jgi:ankyrin repeat protein
LQHGCDVNAVDHEGFTALHSVSSFSSDDTTLIELLLGYGADVTKHAVKFMTALDTAALFGKLQCARALIAAGVDVNIPDMAGVTILHMALVKQHANAVKLLLEHGATAVMNKVSHADCLELLASNERCCSSMTALMKCSTVDTLKPLLAAGADVHVANDVKAIHAYIWQ